MNGNNIYIKANGYTVACTKSNELQVGCETIEIASSSQQGWKEYIAGRKEWSLNVTFLVTAQKPSDISSGVKDTRNPLAVGATYSIVIQNRTSSGDTLSGSAICTKCKITATRGSLCMGSITLKGTGALT